MDPIARIAAALEAIACTTSPEYSYMLGELPEFVWEQINAIPIEDDDGKVIAVEWMGARWGRIDEQNCVIFARVCAGITLILAVFSDPNHNSGPMEEAPEDELTG
jgi:hypothetical protein